ncbi:hypothetical protein JB92DRAFT_3051623 [Gautieria morchelliformis]|nr:hypothetical protein JB92DRAFT_3051623 [Gautieria morchelliformis]
MSVAPQSFLLAIGVTQYSALASLVLFLYDHAITFDAEVMNIWRGPRTLGKLLFLWTRYFGLSSLIIEVTGTFHGSLSNKVYAVYNRKKQLLYGMVGFQLITAAATVVILVFYLPAGMGLPSVDNLTGCYSPLGARNLGACFVPPLANEVVLCLLMLYKLWDRYRNESGSSQLKRLVQDSTVAVHLTNLLVFYLTRRSLVLMAIGWEFAITCTMGCRLLLNMFNHYGSASGQDTTLLQSGRNASYPLSGVRMQSLSSRGVKPPVVAMKECIGK